MLSVWKAREFWSLIILTFKSQLFAGAVIMALPRTFIHAFVRTDIAMIMLQRVVYRTAATTATTECVSLREIVDASMVTWGIDSDARRSVNVAAASTAAALRPMCVAVPWCLARTTVIRDVRTAFAMQRDIADVWRARRGSLTSACRRIRLTHMHPWIRRG